MQRNRGNILRITILRNGFLKQHKYKAIKEKFGQVVPSNSWGSMHDARSAAGSENYNKNVHRKPVVMSKGEPGKTLSSWGPSTAIRSLRWPPFNRVISCSSDNAIKRRLSGMRPAVWCSEDRWYSEPELHHLNFRRPLLTFSAEKLADRTRSFHRQ